MTTLKALHEKLYAGNPHVRFDGGEVASAATPRRGSLLYKPTRICVVFSALCFVEAAFVAAHGGTYTWLTSPANNSWDTTSLNFSDGSVNSVWVDNASSPNNAVFPNITSAIITIPSGETRYVNNMTMSESHDIRGGNIDIAGELTVNGGSTPRLRPNFVGTCFRINSSKTFYFMGTESSQTSTRLRGNFIFAPSGDSCFGPEPASPTENIFVDSGTATLYFGSEVALAHNRTIKIAANSTLGLGASRNFVINSLIKSENSPGCAFSTNTFISISGTWGGTTIFDPGEGRTNIVGHLRTTGRLRIASGVTYVGGGKSSGVGSDAPLYVYGNKDNGAYDDQRGVLEMSGGMIYSSQARYVQVSAYGHVVVTNNSKIQVSNCTWLHGHGSPARLTVGDGGELSVGTMHVSRTQSGAEIHLEEGGMIKALNFGLASDVANPMGIFRFNGGAVQSRTGRTDFFGTPTDAKWEQVKVLVGEKGAVFNTDNGQPIYVGRPLMSDAEHDGGICKIQGGYMVLLTTNCYNGATVVQDGGIQLRADNALPSGTTLRLGSSSGAYVDANTYANASPARDTVQWIGRVEGAGEIRNCTQVHVTNAIAPSATGTITFKQVCDLRGDFEISANDSMCGILEVQGVKQDISGLTLKASGLSSLEEGKHRIFKATNGYTGEFAISSRFPRGWGVKYTADGAYLYPSKGFVLIIK